MAGGVSFVFVFTGLLQSKSGNRGGSTPFVKDVKHQVPLCIILYACSSSSVPLSHYKPSFL